MRWRFLAAAVAVLGCFFFLDASLPVFLDGLHGRAEASRPRTAGEWIRDLQNAGDPTRRSRATDALWQFGRDIVPQVAACLRHDALQVRSSACIALARMGPSAKSAVPDLMEVVRKPTEPTRLQAIQALESIGPAASLASEILATAARDQDATIRHAAIRALGGLGAPAGPELLDLLDQDDLQTRWWAVDALGQPGVSSPAGCDALTRLAAGDSDASLRQAAFAALARQGEPAAGHLQSLLQSGQPAARVEAAMALCKMGTAAQSAAPTLLDALNDDHASVRFWALRSLAALQVDGEADRNRILAALDDPDADVRWQAAETITPAGRRGPGFVVHRRADRPGGRPAGGRLTTAAVDPGELPK